MFNHSEYQRNKYNERKTRYIEQLGGKCVRCGTDEELQFDHKNPDTKEFVITSRISKYSEEILQKELSKCQLLCSTCHLLKSTSELKGRVPWNKGDPNKTKHGTYGAAYPISKCNCKECEAYRNKRRASRRGKA